MADLIIIGGGPAGISAALYTVRAGFDVTVIDNGNSSLLKTERIENYYGANMSGEELYRYGIKQAKDLNVNVVCAEATKLDAAGGFTVETADGKTFSSKALLLATGTKRAMPNIKGIEKYIGKGVSFCAVCDAFFYRGKKVAIIGSGEYAKSEAEDLAVAKEIVHLLNGNKALTEFCHPVIDKKIAEIKGDQKVSGVVFYDGSEIEVDGIFVAEGTAGGFEFAKKLGLLLDKNKIKTDDTSLLIPGLFAAGDCTTGDMQVAKAVEEGRVAAMKIIGFLRK